MATFKDIDLLSQKSTLAGTEKLPVSDTEYTTPNQIAQIAKDYTDTVCGNIETILAAI
jgi:hypothetical protein